MIWLYIITAVLVSIPVIATLIVPVQIKKDRARIRKELSLKRIDGVPPEEWPHKLIGIDEEVEQELQKLYPNCKL